MAKDFASTTEENAPKGDTEMKICSETKTGEAMEDIFNNSDLEYSIQAKSSKDDPNHLVMPRELQISTSYGHLAFKEWGNSKAPNKILCLHGWLDNAGSFDPLIPLLLDSREIHDNYHILAWDEPGIG